MQANCVLWHSVCGTLATINKLMQWWHLLTDWQEIIHWSGCGSLSTKHICMWSRVVKVGTGPLSKGLCVCLYSSQTVECYNQYLPIKDIFTSLCLKLRMLFLFSIVLPLQVWSTGSNSPPIKSCCCNTWTLWAKQADGICCSKMCICPWAAGPSKMYNLPLQLAIIQPHTMTDMINNRNGHFRPRGHGIYCFSKAIWTANLSDHSRCLNLLQFISDWV